MAREAAQPNGTAIVIGAGIAGLLAARVLADRFEKVVIMEKDAFPLPGENRRGVPQGRHVHLLLERGRRVMERYLPGLTGDLVQGGACDIRDVSAEIGWFHHGFHKQGSSGIRGLGVARPTLEAAVRSRVLCRSNIEILEDCWVLGLEADERHWGVRGVRFVSPRYSGEERTRTADLVVDATGRGSRTPGWLEDMGYQRPDQEEVRVDVGYTTCLFRRKPHHLNGRKALIFLPKPSDERMGVIESADGDRWIVTLGGYLGRHAPNEYEKFLAFARDMPAPDIHEVITDAERLTDPVPFRFPASRRLLYEKLRRFPERYVVIGDALSSFNPVYGQGMTVAALEAEALARSLDDGPRRLARRFFAQAKRIIDGAWGSAVGTDLGFPGVEGRRTPLIRLLAWYLPRLHEAASVDAEVSIAFLRVINMLAPPLSILHPRIVWRVWKGVRRAAPQPLTSLTE